MHADARKLLWAGSQAAGEAFADEQRRRLETIAEHVASYFGIEAGKFELAPFDQRGGLGRVLQLFGSEMADANPERDDLATSEVGGANKQQLAA